MIDIENDVFNGLAVVLRERFPGINVYSRLILSPTVFPCVCVEEGDNSAYRETQDSGSLENHAQVMVEVNVFSNRTNGAKAECKAIFGAIDDVMNGYGFTRLGKHPGNEEEPITYRLTGRYRAVVSENKTIYRR